MPTQTQHDFVVAAPPAREHAGGARTARARRIPRLTPLLAVGIVPAAPRASTRRRR